MSDQVACAQVDLFLTVWRLGVHGQGGRTCILGRVLCLVRPASSLCVLTWWEGQGNLFYKNTNPTDRSPKGPAS